MATVMTSRQESGAPPPLPARGNTVTKGPHNQLKQTRHVARSNSTETPPPVPPSTHRRQSDTSQADFNNHPLPARSHTTPKIQRQKIETKSFVDRHTAKAFSPGGSTHTDAPLPPLPSVSSMPHGHSSLRRPSPGTSPKQPSTSSSSPSSHHRFNDVFEVEDPPPPPPPVSRPPHLSRRSHSVSDDLPPPPPQSNPPRPGNRSLNDLEGRFVFHDLCDFPPPEEFEDIKKRYPSTTKGGRDAPGVPMGSFYHKDPSSIGYL